MNIEIKKDDIAPYVYFVCSIAQQSTNGMYGALSTKKDFIGGIFDRWINIIPESISFNKYFLPKAIKKSQKQKCVNVFSDFFMYDPKEVGIAPDVIGLQIDEKIVPFVRYDDTKNKKEFWVTQANCPQIEVKSFFGKKYMVSLRNQHYDNKYLVMIEANIDVDYLLSFFDKTTFPQSQTAKLNMPNDFIVSNTRGLISQTKDVDFEKEYIGSINVLTTTTATTFMQNALKLQGGDIPRYYKNIEKRKQIIKEEKYEINKTLDYFCKQTNGLYRFNNNWYSTIFTNDKEKTLDIAIEGVKNLLIIKKTKDNITVKVLNDNSKINGITLEKDKQYIIEFGTFGKIAGEEYFMNKSVLNYMPNKEAELIEQLSNIIKNN